MNYEEEVMCPHDEFDIVYYEDGILIRKCRYCGALEIYTDWWASLENVSEAIHNAEEGDDGCN